MISQDRDYEDILRDALRAAAESVEPASDGLERIRHRAHSRRSARSMLARTADWLRLYWIRLSVRLESSRWELTERGIRHAPTGAHRSGRTPAAKTAGRLGPAAAWLKPAFAVAAVIAVVAVGMVTLNRVQPGLFTPTDSVTSPGHRHAPTAPDGVSSPGLWQPPLGVYSSPSPTSRKKSATTVLPAIACTPRASATPTPTPTGSATPTPTPTPSDSATASPTPTPSDTGSPTDTPTTGSSGGSTATGSGSSTATGSGSSTATVKTDALSAPYRDGGMPDVSCGSTPTPKSTS